ncbi:hypothetical protein [Roseateles sp. BYS87W]|uniref:Uncharacterized protein n=1 Tax=Pelomonas baiyunensis TaxID=3299026 RepID=A0ABW7H2J6_9BURK
MKRISAALDDPDDLPSAIAKWLLEHPADEPRQFGPLPPGWSKPVLTALDALAAAGAVPVLCKFKLGFLRLRVRPRDLATPVQGATLQVLIQQAQAACAELCCQCGAPHKLASIAIDGCRCTDCRNPPR